MEEEFSNDLPKEDMEEDVEELNEIVISDAEDERSCRMDTSAPDISKEGGSRRSIFDRMFNYSSSKLGISRDESSGDESTSTSKEDLEKFIRKENSALTEEQIVLAKSFIQTADKNDKESHLKSIKKKRIGKICALIPKIITFLIGGTSLVMAIETGEPFAISVCAIASFAGVFQIYNETINPEKEAEKLKKISHDYRNYSRSLKNSLSHGVDDRPEKVKAFMLKAEFDLRSIETEIIDV